MAAWFMVFLNYSDSYLNRSHPAEESNLECSDRLLSPLYPVY